MVAKLKVITPKRSSERESLAQAIAEAAAVERAVHKARDAKARARDMVSSAEAKLVEATAGIEKARTEQSNKVVKALKSGAVAPTDTGPRNARLKEADARDELEAAKVALASCEVALAEHEYDLQQSLILVTSAVDDVLRSESAARVLKEVRILQEKLIAARVALQFLERRKLLPEELAAEAKNLLGFREFPSWFGNVEFFSWEKYEEHKRWVALHAELTKNADASLLD